MVKIGPDALWKGCPPGTLYRIYKSSLNTNFKYLQLFEILGQKYLKLQIYVFLTQNGENRPWGALEGVPTEKSL